MAIVVKRDGANLRPLIKPEDMVPGKSYRRAGAPSEGANYRDVIVVVDVDNTGRKFLLDLKDFRLSPPHHSSLQGMSFVESDIIINA